MRYAFALLVLFLSSSVSAQTLITAFDLAKFDRGRVIGTPAALDTDSDPATTEWLVRYEDASYLLPAYFTVVVQTTPAGICVGMPFLMSALEQEGALQSNGTLHVRRDDVLAIYRLTTPQCDD